MRRFLKSRDGNITVLFVFSAFAIFLAAGAAIDYSMWTTQRRALQEAADAGAIAGTRRLTSGNIAAAAAAEDFAEQYARSNLKGAVASAVLTVSVNNAANETQIIARLPGARSLTALMVKSDPEIRVRSVAKATEVHTACLMALNETASNAISITGDVTVDAVGCGIQVDSSHSSALDSTGGPDMTAENINVVGGYSGSGFSPAPTTGAERYGDPFRDIDMPAHGACDYTNKKVNTNVTLSPGVYCGGIDIRGGNVTLLPGIYFIVDGPFKISGHGAVVGDQVTIALIGSAYVDISGTASIHLSPPVSGSLAGFSFYQDRNAPAGVSAINGTGNMNITGAVYLPKHTLQIRGSGGGTAANPEFVAVIADKVDLVGTAHLVVSSGHSGLPEYLRDKLTRWNVRLIE